jgi:hypothetical protein
MPNVLLSPEKAMVVRALLKTGLKQQSIANMFGVSRQTITKINVGMKDKNAHSGRWKHIDDLKLDMSGCYLPCELQSVLTNLSNEEAGRLIKNILNLSK